jgi:hypothetical protein
MRDRWVVKKRVECTGTDDSRESGGRVPRTSITPVAADLTFLDYGVHFADMVIEYSGFGSNVSLEFVPPFHHPDHIREAKPDM